MKLEFGLSQRTIDEIHAIFAKHSKVKKVLIYGSRAMGKYRDGSDIDLTIFGEGLGYDDILHLSGELEDSSIPYLVDLSIFEDLAHAKLKDHINRQGKVFYDRYAGWKTMKLGEICENLDTKRIPITKNKRIAGNIPYYGATGVVDWVADYIFNEKLVLVGEDGAKWDVGDKTAFIIEGKSWVNNHAHVLRPIESLVMHEWLAYYLTGIDLNPWVTGLTVPKLNQAQLRSIPIPTPPLPEQQRIVAKLDAAFTEIDTAIAATEKKQEEVNKLKQAILTKALQPSKSSANAWQTAKLGDVCELVYGKALPPLERVENTGFPAFGANGIKTYASKPLYEKPSIIIGRKGSAGELNKVSVPFWALDVAYYVVHDEETINLDYLYHTLTLKNIPRLARGVKPGINRNDVYAQEILLPPLAEQKQIVAKLDTAFTEIDNFTQATKKKIANHKALKSAILTQELQPKNKN